jgi:TPP-dependent pyruvate/acetoin dehydrogenase alpha subunit
MNMASIWDLPVLFLCEHNLYGMSSCAEEMVSVDSIAQRGSSYGIEGKSVDGNDVEIVYHAVQDAANFIRKKKRPFLLEVRTYRFSGHSKNDKRLYRTREEEEAWSKRDPLKLFSDRLIERGHLTADVYEQMQKVEQDAIDQIAEQLIQQRNELSIEEASAFVYSDGGQR